MEQFEQLLHRYVRKMCQNAALIEKLDHMACRRQYASGEMLLAAGERSEYICLILQGMVRGVYVDEEGTEITKCFSGEEEWCCSYNFFTKEESPFYIEAIEPTTVAAFPVEALRETLTAYPALQKELDRLTQQIFLEAEKRVFSFSGMDAKQRYVNFVQEHPEIVGRVKQEYVASYLGITPSSLSRIKRSL